METPQCKCGNDARKVTVKKEGKNQGREFWQCKGIEKRCGLLLWVDEMEKSKNKSTSENGSAKAENGNTKAPAEDSDAPPKCKCGNDARRVTVKKEGKNKGREFWQCKGIEKRCGLLIWITPEIKSDTPAEKDNAGEAAEKADSNPPCKCGNESRRLTVKKEGKNQGREFYQCKGTDKRCGFFKWIEAEKSPAKREIESDSSEREGKKARVE